MQRTKQIAIILPDTLQSIGLQSLLIDYFHPVEVCYFPSFQYFREGSDPFDYYFTNTETFVLYADYFLPRKLKTTVLIQSREEVNNGHTPYSLNVMASQEMVIEQLQLLFDTDNSNSMINELTKELSARETDVLQLIVKGYTNKDIADKLNISLNTVLTHRKNITSKLGIKTVSGLTFYAIMNGLISADDIEL